MELVALRRRGEAVKERDNDMISPERRKVWIEPHKCRGASERKVAVVYYLSRKGHLDHPHFMEISIPSGEGLYLRDVIKRLDLLRGNGMAGLYAWSSKRSYKSGFVWHDLCEDDYIYPAHGNEYILKGSELLKVDDSSQDVLAEVPKSLEHDSDISVPRKNRSAWGSFDINEYKVYKNKQLAPDQASIKNMDAGTQTADQSQAPIKEEEEEEEVVEINIATEIDGEEVSPPCSSSSSQTLEAVIKADGIVPIGTIIYLFPY